MQRLKKTVDMTEGPFFKKMIAFAIPLIVTGLLQSFYNAADLIVIGQFRGDVAVAAVGSTGSITNMILGLLMGLSVGAGVCVAHHIGAKEQEEVSKVVHTSVLLSVIVGVVMAIVGFSVSESVLIFMGTPETVLPHATLYMRIIFLGAPGSMMYNYIAAMLRSEGDSKRPLIFLSISGIVNVLLNLVLVTVFNMGVEGVAIATITAQYLSAIMSLIYLTRTSGMLRISFRKLRLDSEKVKRMLFIGIPSGLQSTLFSLSNVLIQSSINSFGDSVMAGSAAASNLESFMYIAMNAIYHVAITFIGQNVGAKKYKNIRRLTVYSVGIVVGVAAVSGSLILLFRYPLVHLYVTSDEAISAAFDRMWIIVPTYFMCGLMEVFCGGLRALDRSVTAMIISLCGACGLRILWIETVFKYVMHSPTGVYVSYPVTWFMTTMLQMLFMIFTVRKIMRRDREPATLIPPR